MDNSKVALIMVIFPFYCLYRVLIDYYIYETYI